MVVINTKKLACHWCGSPDSFKCSCGFRTCLECKKFPNEKGCVHEKYEPIESDGWILDGDNYNVQT